MTTIVQSEMIKKKSVDYTGVNKGDKFGEKILPYLLWNKYVIELPSEY